MAIVNLDAICGSQFWDYNLTWNTNDPELTTCFEQTVLVWIPCAFLWCFSVLETYYILNSATKNIPWNWLNISKVALTCFLILLSVLDIILAFYHKSEGYEVYGVQFYSPSVKILTFCLSVTLLVYSRRHGLRTSGTQFFFWFLLVLCGIPELRSNIRMGISDFLPSPVYSFVSYIIYYMVVVSLFLLNCCADAAPKFSKHSSVEIPSPEESASFLSKVFYFWMEPLLWKGVRNPLETKDLWNMSYENSCAHVFEKFNKYFKQPLDRNYNVSDTKAEFHNNSTNVSFSKVRKKDKGSRISILPAMLKAFGSLFFFASFLKIFQIVLMFISPQVLRLLIQFIDNKEPLWKGYVYAVLILCATTMDTIVSTQYFHRMYILGIRIRAALTDAIFHKALHMSSSARKESTVGEIVNLMSVDAYRFIELTIYIGMLWAAPLEIGVAMYFLWNIMGPAVFAGLAVMIIMIPLNAVIANRIKVIQIRQMKSKDERLKVTNEVLNGMKVLKLYAWEPSFEQRILNIRNKETKILKQAVYLFGCTAFVWTCAPFLVSLASFATFVLISEDNILDAETAFVSLALFNLIRLPLAMMPMLVVSVTQARVSIKRINKLLNSRELDPNSVTHDPTEKHALVIDNGTFSWGPEEPIILKDINLRVNHGTLMAVVGSVGAGKSTLISAFLGDMDKISGRVNTKGTIAYVPQQAWIQNCSLRDNILFGKEFEGRLYHKVLDACALKPDLEILPGGDSIEIGEKGINLSGGQKQRVSLARAVYRDTDIYFLDDPLSAVDSHVGKHIFDNVIGPSGMLQSKTRVLVTNNITFLPEVDIIVVLKDGEVTEKGTYKELLMKKGTFAEFLVQHLKEIHSHDRTSESDLEEIRYQLDNVLAGDDIHIKSLTSSSHELTNTGDKISPKVSLNRQFSVDSCRSDSLKLSHSGSLRVLCMDDEVVQLPGEKLTETEKVETGSVKLQVYIHYVRNMGLRLCILTLIFNVFFQTFLVSSNMWLSEWTNTMSAVVANNATGSKDQSMYLGIYGGLGVGLVVSTFVCDLCPRLGCWIAARAMHNIMLKGIMRAQLTFFDVTPLGRIISRFSKDIDVLDSSLPHQICDCVACLFEVIATLFVISYSTPIFISVILPIGIIYYFVQRVYVSSSRQLKRLESISRSPVFSHFGESITGASVIRAYGERERFERESEIKVDTNHMSYFPSIMANRWLAVRLETTGNIIIFFASLFAVLSRDSISAGLVGLSISYSLQITGTLNWLVRMTSDVETNIVAVERIKEYSDVKQEASWNDSSPKVSEEWPEKGKVEFKNYEVRYREGLDPVLKEICFVVNGGEKVGIVGRTGAGKSSLTLGLFRIIEAAKGSILIDDVDISKLGLHTLRSRLTIIPQDPVLFSGTLRENLDPFHHLPDNKLWKALEHAHLLEFVKGLPAGLNHEISEGGENLSVGQRQLVCLVRALLRKTRVLILDEATAAVDLQTDELIQKTIRNEFSDCTVLTIAHRLNTILDSDKIIVLDKGRIAEFDAPQSLLSDRKSLFYGMAKDAGLVS